MIEMAAEHGYTCAANMPARLGILGGTFNPPHFGHLFMADAAHEEFGLQPILLLPLGEPPHKQRENVMNKDIRACMAALMAGERSFLELCTLELDRPGYTYTVDTLRMLAASLKRPTELHYIVGSDTLFELETWREFREVFALTGFCCVHRPGDDVSRIAAQAERLRAEYGAKIQICSRTAPDISSTEIRMRLQAGRSVRGLVPECIRTFLEENYAFG